MSFIPAAIAAVGKAVSSIGLGTTASVAGTGIGALTAYQQGRYQSAIAEANQKVANQNAGIALERSSQEAQDQDALTLAAIGEQLAVQSASGLSTSSRSSMMTRKSTRQLGRKDSLNVAHAGRLQANQYLTQGQNFGMQAEAANLQAQGSLLEGMMTAGSLIGDASSVRNKNRFNPRPYSAPRSLMQ